MLALRLQYFLCFATMGALLPFLPVYLSEHKHLSEGQIGAIVGTGGVAIMLTPILMTFLADRRVDGRRLIAILFILDAAMLLLITFVDSFPALLIAFLFNHLSIAPIPALQDGLNFTVQERRKRAGQAGIPYHRMRLWGTFGFMLPSVVMYGLLAWGLPLESVMYVTMAASLVGALNAFALPDVRIAEVHDEPVDDPERDLAAESRLPTLAAIRACLEPHVLVFCVAMLLAVMAGAAYYTIYPMYLRSAAIQIDQKWLGLISSIGVTLEIAYMLSFGWLVDRFGLRRFMAVGMLIVALRMALLWLWPVAAIAIGSQMLHGAMVLVLHVAPPTFLNHQADDRFRNSMQGLYAMAVLGVGRLIGGVVAGRIAEIKLKYAFAAATVLCIIAALLFIFAFNERDKPLIVKVKPNGEAE